jgi:hypothetical protein
LDTKISVKDQHVLVIGSEVPWFEAVLLSKGAAKITTFDYVGIESRHPQVSSAYIRETLRAYGFGDKFIQYFNTLYNGLSVKVLVNGFFSEKINIERGVKQGDALSCSLFILCMDPLIRNLNENKKIEPITFKSKLTHTVVKHKASGYADDIAIVCRNNLGSVQEVFFEYERLTRKSGLELNADKTEILRIGHLNEQEVLLSINYMGIAYKIRNVDQMKICGLYFCNDPVVEYDHNILSKVEKFELQLKQDLLGQVSRLRKREELKLCKFILESCNLKVSL